MSAITMEYPIIIRVIKDYVEVSQPDLDIRLIRGKVLDVVHKREQIGTIVLDMWEEINRRVMSGSAKKQPSTPSTFRKMPVAELMTTGEVASILGLHKQTIRRMCVAGKLQCITTPGGHKKVKMSDPLLAEFIKPKSAN